MIARENLFYLCRSLRDLQKVEEFLGGITTPEVSDAIRSAITAERGEVLEVLEGLCRFAFSHPDGWDRDYIINK